MEQMVKKLRRWWAHPIGKKYASKVGFGASLLLFGWMSGVLIAGVFDRPPVLSAAISDVASVSSSPQVDRLPNPGFSDVAKKVRPAVVHITVVKNMTEALPSNPFDSMPDFFKAPIPRHRSPEPHGMGMGSGVIVSSDGYVVTNHHVVNEASAVTVTLLDKREFKGEVIGNDPQTDLAIIKIDGENFPYVEWGDSSKLQVGDYVLAVGHPFGLTATMTQGIVSALGRGGMGISQYEDFIQTDAAINPGNSGGALVNAQGELIGINTAIFSRTGGYQGVGFAVPSDLAKPVYASLREDGKVIRGFLGVGIQELTPDLATTLALKESTGALVTDVRPGSPAEMAGIKRGDVIKEYRGNPIPGPRALQKEVLRTPVGTTVKISVVRNSQKQELQTTIAVQSENMTLAKSEHHSTEKGLAGVRVEPVNSRLAHEWGLDSVAQGVVVTAVLPGSPADQAGLSRGDVIREVNKHTIGSIEDYEKAADSMKEGEVALLFINRSGVPLFLTIKV